MYLRLDMRNRRWSAGSRFGAVQSERARCGLIESHGVAREVVADLELETFAPSRADLAPRTCASSGRVTWKQDGTIAR